ncbi:MAG: hypothetical protein HY064_06070 [Bacteroidetes bacterium]|nr:hypothetical protein [Bacteroidota bacterium]
MKYSVILLAFLFFSCSGDQKKDPSKTDSLSSKDSLKKAMRQDLQPADEIHQFNWIYSAFADAATSGKDSLADKFISPNDGLWIIYAPGAMPEFENVKHFDDFDWNGKKLLPLDRNNMMAVPVEGELPVADCNKSSGYSKEGCFTTQLNIFADEKAWTYSSLSETDQGKVKQLASKITRTVVNTAVGKFYFTLSGSTWYLTFIDLRVPCDA